MYFSIEPTNGVPIYEQLVRQVKFAVAEGVLVGGEMLPSVRQLAQELALNPNTISRAYSQLQSDQVLEPMRGRGLVVRGDALPHCTAARHNLLATRLRGVLEECWHAGLRRAEVTSMFESEWSYVESP